MNHQTLAKQIAALTEGVPYLTANLANTAAAIWQALDGINWAGFYILEEGKLEPTRYDSYLKLYEKASQIKLWELK